MNCSTPRPASRSPIAMAINSSSLARRLGVGSPFTERWLTERDDENPIAPARMASAAKARMACRSSGVAASSCAPRSPITSTRSAPCGSCAATSMSRGRAASASR